MLKLKKISYLVSVLVPCTLFLGAVSLPSLAADEAPPPLSQGPRFVHKDGETLYRAICQGCHMPKGEGAIGAGAYPALAKNARLVASAYIAINVLHGLKGMPGFSGMLSDEQVAAVVNYTRTHFGNNYADAISAEDVKKLR